MHMQIPMVKAFILLHIYSECVYAHIQIPGKYCAFGACFYADSVLFYIKRIFKKFKYLLNVLCD